MASLTQWTWVWASSRSWWWTGKPGMLQSMGLQRVGHDWATEQQHYKSHEKSKLIFFFFNESFALFCFLADLGLGYCAQSFSSCSERGQLFHGTRASHCRGFSFQSTGSRYAGFSSCSSQALEPVGSVVVVHGLSCSLACGIFPNQGSNPCSLRWQADS